MSSEAMATLYQAVANLVLTVGETVVDHQKAEDFEGMAEDKRAAVEQAFQVLFTACDDFRRVDEQAVRDQMEKEIKGYGGWAE